jgi:hypothetical protein
VSLNCHAQEVMQGTKVFHSKFLLQGSNHTKELLRGGSEDDVIHIEE